MDKTVFRLRGRSRVPGQGGKFPSCAGSELREVLGRVSSKGSRKKEWHQDRGEKEFSQKKSSEGNALIVAQPCTHIYIVEKNVSGEGSQKGRHQE